MSTFHRATQRARRALAAAAFVAAAVATAGPRPVEAKERLTFATLAPERSAWDKVFKAFAKEIEKASGGEIEVKIYGGGVQGDETVAVQKMRSGQIDGAAVTAVGLGAISQNVLVLQLPMLFRSYTELDYVRDKMKGQFEKEFADKGFVLLGWGDVGFANTFSNTPIARPSDISQAKIWTWNSDPIAQSLVTAAGGNPIPLGVPDVMPSLETGLIDAFTASPLAAIALRWFSKAKYMTKTPVAMGIGATVISQKSWDRLSPEQQALVRTVADKYHGVLIKKVRKDNDKSVGLLVEQGIQLVEVDEAAKKEWLKLGERVWDELAGKVYSKDILAEVRKHIAAVRK